ncbi:MAG TPA: ankyrin repeat domain-containing protein [Steroidobacteraceae bacterium]|jgi:hypothetical protein|nr:ankyrin repeat domain-containing protein [Steroidobacteraceae bacterium]
MTSKDSGQDPELLDRYRRASDTGPVAPSDAVRGAILAEGRRVAGQLAAQGATPPFDASRRAANDSRWKITAFGTAGAAVLAALLFAPRYWEEGPPSPPSPPAATAPPAAAGPAPKLESIAPMAKTPERKIPKPVQRYAPAPAPALAPAPAPAPLALRPEPAPIAPPAYSARAQGGVRSMSADRAVDSRDALGRTPLLLAVEQNRPAVVRLLLARGADPNVADNAGRTPLQQAKSKNLREIAGILEEAGAR